MGDGLMCLFGLEETDPQKICREAVTTAVEMQRQLVKLNEYLKRQFFGEEFSRMLKKFRARCRRRDFLAKSLAKRP